MWLPRARYMTDFQCICNYIVEIGGKCFFSDFWLSQQRGREEGHGCFLRRWRIQRETSLRKENLLLICKY